jgi:hypothetical protein
MRMCVTAAAVLAAASGALASGRLIAIDSARVVYEIDMATGARTAIGTASGGGTTGGLARDPATGTIYLTSTSLDSLFALNLDTFEATLVGAYGVDVVMHGLEWDSSTGTLYGGSNGSLYSIEPATGTATLVGASGLTSFLNLGYNSATNVLYATSSSTDSSYVIDRATGAVTLLGLLGAPTNPNGLAFNPDNGLMYLICNNTDSLYTLDTTTGAATLVGSNGSGNLLGLVYVPDAGGPACYANCDNSTVAPVLNVADFTCFLQQFAAGASYANCDGSTTEPVLNVADFTCFLQRFAEGCR